jgi:hypothetical protein
VEFGQAVLHQLDVVVRHHAARGQARRGQHGCPWPHAEQERAGVSYSFMTSDSTRRRGEDMALRRPGDWEACVTSHRVGGAQRA